jgi:NADPH:quinone reductase-like Zn-dependent oxidoreductase
MRDRYGTPDVVELRDVPVPVPADGEVLVRVKAASVNRADLDGIRPRPGFVRLFIGLRAPRNQRVGIDAAGVVEAVGEAATRFKPGDEVMADLFAQQGAFAEYAVAPESAVAPIPAGLTFEEAATLPHSAVLALQGLRRRDGRTIKAGDRVMVVGASGNVGPFAVQIARAMGAEVTGVSSAAKTDLVASLGADHAIAYDRVDITRTRERYDWILDTDSHHSVRRMRRLLRPGGAYVSLGGEAGPLLSTLVAGSLLSIRSDRWSGLMLWWKPFHPPDVERLRELIAAGQLKAVIDRSYPLDQVVEALRHVDEGRARGKVAITV